MKRPAGSRKHRPRSDRSPPERAPDLLRHVIAEALTLNSPADAVLRRFFREHRSLGRRDRADIADTVFDVLRNKRLYAHFAQAGEGPLEDRLAQLSRVWRDRASSLRDAVPAASAHPPPQPEWLARLAAANPDSLPVPVALSLPDWLYQKLCERFGEAEAQALGRALLEPAPLHLRTNLLKTRREALVERLVGEGVRVRPLSIAPCALEVDGHPALERSAAFEEGAFEVQDAGSQLLALLVGARRGQTVVDLCAGAGGKTLALAASMNSTGQIFACDVSIARLQRLRPRLTRSGATNVQPFAIDSLTDRKLERLVGRAHAVLVDAPCTGSGTLRRNPDLKWRFGPEDLSRLCHEQRSILAAAARLVAPDGVLVYATCSLLAEENEAQARWFEERYPEFQREDACPIMAASGATLPDDAFAEGALVCVPHRHGTDSFFGIRWRRVRLTNQSGAAAGASG